MGKFWIYGRRLVEWLVFWAIGHGIILFLATREIYPDRFVASMITKVTEAPIWADWIMSGAFGLLMTFILEIFFWNRRSQHRPNTAHVTNSQEVTQQNETRYLTAVRNDALKITLGETSDFEHTQPRSDYVIRTVLACVENIDTSHFISNCEASVEINGIDHPLVECFTLNPIERRFIPVAKRHESPIDNFIHIWALPKPGGIGGIQFRPKLPLSGGFITIKAMSTETSPAQLVCRVFVDDSGKLKLEKA
jgi:hypothetical protein